MRERVLALSVVAAIVAGSGWAHAGDLHLDPALSPGEFRELAEHLAEAIAPPAGPSRALGVMGLEVDAGAVWVGGDRDAPWWRRTLEGASRAAGGLAGVRVAVRKGLPLGLDVGASVGSVAGETFHGLEGRVALVRGSTLVPAVGLRAAWSELGSGPVDLTTTSVTVTVSKGVGPLVPYGALGVRRWEAEASWGDPDPLRHRVEATTAVAAVGVALRLPLLGLRAELRRGSATAAFLSAALRF